MHYLVVLGNFHTPATEGIEISWQMRGSARPKNFKKHVKLTGNWNFKWGRGLRKKSLPGGGMNLFWNYMCTLQQNGVLLCMRALIVITEFLSYMYFVHCFSLIKVLYHIQMHMF